METVTITRPDATQYTLEATPSGEFRITIQHDGKTATHYLSAIGAIRLSHSMARGGSKLTTNYRALEVSGR